MKTIHLWILKGFYASRIVDDFNGAKINFINLPHLKANKQAAGT